MYGRLRARGRQGSPIKVLALLRGAKGKSRRNENDNVFAKTAHPQQLGYQTSSRLRKEKKRKNRKIKEGEADSP